jgi:hypothetical protein
VWDEVAIIVSPDVAREQHVARRNLRPTVDESIVDGSPGGNSHRLNPRASRPRRGEIAILLEREIGIQTRHRAPALTSGSAM